MTTKKGCQARSPGGWLIHTQTELPTLSEMVGTTNDPWHDLGGIKVSREANNLQEFASVRGKIPSSQHLLN